MQTDQISLVTSISSCILILWVIILVTLQVNVIIHVYMKKTSMTIPNSTFQSIVSWIAVAMITCVFVISLVKKDQEKWLSSALFGFTLVVMFAVSIMLSLGMTKKFEDFSAGFRLAIMILSPTALGCCVAATVLSAL